LIICNRQREPSSCIGELAREILYREPGKTRERNRGGRDITNLFIPTIMVVKP
jgi:hypothetical protein